MAIRLRRIPGVGLVALCAARTVEKEGDIYLDDEIHHALGSKFWREWAAQGRMWPPEHGFWDQQAVDHEESNNSARAWWDRTYGASA